LKRRFKIRHREWLEVSGEPDQLEDSGWPLEVNLGIPTENQALKQVEDVRAWVAAWQSWNGVGSLSWGDRRWRKLGTQPVPEKLLRSGPGEVAQWIEEKDQHAAETLPLLTDPEQAVYQAIKRNAWGQNVRLEQERIAWDVAWKTLQQAI
jgi:hypothetical protein